MELELKLGGVEVEVKGWRGMVTVAGIGLIVAAVLQELSRPPAQRDWHGDVLGFVPYDFRAPTMDRMKSALWNPESDDVLTPRAFGVGWDINFGAVAKKLDLVA